MSIRTPFRIRALPALLAAGAVLAGAALVGSPPPARADGVDDKIKGFEEYVKTKPDSQGLRNQIAELALLKDPRVAGALKKLLRHKDEEVLIAVAQNIGKQGDPKIASLLKSMADMKDMDERPKLMAALLEGVGDAGAKQNYDFLLKIAKKYLDSNADIASAAYRAAANHVTADTVDDMIKQLVRADYTTVEDNAVKRAARGACKPVLLDILKKVTGEQINDVKIWNEWWREAKKKHWKPPVPGQDDRADINAKDEFEDSAYGFIIKKPSRAWFFRKPDGANPIIVLEALDEGQRAAWVEVTAVGTKNFKSKTPEAWAEEMKATFEGKFRDIREAEWEKKSKVAGETAINQIVFGQHKDFDAVQMHNLYLMRSEVMYQIVTFWKSGKPASMKADIEEIIKTFKVTR